MEKIHRIFFNLSSVRIHIYTTCPVHFPIAVIKTITKSNLWREGYILPYSLHSVMKTLKAGTEAEWRNSAYCLSSYGKLILLSYTTKEFLYVPRIGTTHIRLPLSYQSFIKRMSQRLTYRSHWWRHFLKPEKKNQLTSTPSE